MMRHLLWDESPGEIRTGLIEDGRLTEFRIIRARQKIPVGALHDARIVSNLGGGKALVALDGEGDALLEHAPKLPEGSWLVVEIVRAPIPEPGRWKRARVRPAFKPLPFRGRVGGRACQDSTDSADSPHPNPVEPLGSVRGTDPSTPKGEGLIPTITDRDRIEAAGFDELVEAAMSGEFPIAGGMLSIERTRAMTMIDIDGSGDALALNLAAAREIPRLLRLLDIGGQVGIDFLSLPDRKARLAVDAALAEACTNLGPHERTAINGFGFAQIVCPRPGPSVPEILCGTTPGCLSLESRAIALLRAASRSVGHGKRQLVAAPAIIDQLKGWPEELEELRKALGTEIELFSDSGAGGYGYVHVSP